MLSKFQKVYVNECLTKSTFFHDKKMKYWTAHQKNLFHVWFKSRHAQHKQKMNTTEVLLNKSSSKLSVEHFFNGKC